MIRIQDKRFAAFIIFSGASSLRTGDIGILRRSGLSWHHAEHRLEVIGPQLREIEHFPNFTTVFFDGLQIPQATKPVSTGR